MPATMRCCWRLAALCHGMIWLVYTWSQRSDRSPTVAPGGKQYHHRELLSDRTTQPISHVAPRITMGIHPKRIRPVATNELACGSETKSKGGTDAEDHRISVANVRSRSCLAGRVGGSNHQKD
mmetsp:Transcript_26581/g.74357  ORF Transcript_26581/g.74357 Transcript_26581/m.74357 type:complete len:123 (-) Transcript_26581:1088-1456(-)